ncbi:M1 family aminopeptidase [Gammaproteobacteria bacterium]|nr:M1 family aminopeptidase [Gammaproteobacteria bacterium]
MRWFYNVLLAACVGLSGCGDNVMPVEPGVSAELAQYRATSISDLSYELTMSVPEDAQAALVGVIVIEFDLVRDDFPLQIDFRHGDGAVVSVRSNGRPLQHRVESEHIVIPTGELSIDRNSIEIEFRAPQHAVNRNPEYVYTLFVPDRARSAFPLFDQPDLKARYRLALSVPADWKAMSNGKLSSERVSEGRREYRFAATKPISSYLFSFVAGKFDEVTRELGRRRMTMLHRETDEKKVTRNLDAVFRIHAESLDWLEGYTGIDYPFQKFAFALIPDFPYSGMEHVGAIQYRSSSLLLDEAPSESELLGRAQLIAHETAHMWFGDLVTMRWFNDVWTKEVFANFMADKIVNPQFPDVDHDLNFLVSHYPQAYAVDRTAGANPIRQQLDNLSLAGQMYGPIIYHKAPIMMRQLELLLGEEKFRAGLREYLTRYSFANATWPELIDILDAKTDVDLATWSEVWVNTAGMPAFAFARDGESSSATSQRGLEQIDPAASGRLWPQEFSLWSAENGLAESVRFTRSHRAALPMSLLGTPGDELLLNADGLGYGHFPTGLRLFDRWDGLTPLRRGVLLINSFEDLIARPYGDPQAYLAVLIKVLAREPNPLLIDLAGHQLQYVYLRLLTPSERDAFAPTLEAALWDAMVVQSSVSMTKLFFKLLSQIALSEPTLERLYSVWNGTLAIDKLTLQEPEQIRLAELLAVRLPLRAHEILETQLGEIRSPDRKRRLSFIAPALSPDPETRERFFASLSDPAMRSTEVWVTSALRHLHDPTRTALAEKYIAPALDLLEEVQVTGDIFFPSAWLDATLASHSSTEAARIVRTFLDAREDLNPQLRMKVLQSADSLFRASDLLTVKSGGE